MTSPPLAILKSNYNFSFLLPYVPMLKRHMEVGGNSTLLFL